MKFRTFATVSTQVTDVRKPFGSLSYRMSQLCEFFIHSLFVNGDGGSRLHTAPVIPIRVTTEA